MFILWIFSTWINLLTVEDDEQKEESLAASSSISNAFKSSRSFLWEFSALLNFSIKESSTESWMLLLLFLPFSRISFPNFLIVLEDVGAVAGCLIEAAVDKIGGSSFLRRIPGEELEDDETFRESFWFSLIWLINFFCTTQKFSQVSS